MSSKQKVRINADDKHKTKKEKDKAQKNQWSKNGRKQERWISPSN